MPYDNSGKYLIYQNGDCSDCGDSTPSPVHAGCKECSCCPPGLVEQRDASGNILGCFTPNDANLYMVNTFRCPDGYVKVIDGTDFIGCMTVDDYITWKKAQTP